MARGSGRGDAFGFGAYFCQAGAPVVAGAARTRWRR
jgi:hypothetical protein